MTIQNQPAASLDSKRSLLWLALAVGCFHAAYSSLRFPAAGLLIFGYAYALVRLTDQTSVRRAFYFGLATGFLCYAPQLYFFWNIFGPAASVLWLIIAFWVGLFTAIVCGAIRRWGKAKAAWLIPIVWTGLEYFRSELYYLKFSWLNVGYALPIGSALFGTYGVALLIFSAATFFSLWRQIKMSMSELLALLSIGALLFALTHRLAESKSSPRVTLSLVGIQMEFPSPGVIPKALDGALAKNTNAPIFILSEYTLDGPPTDALKDWCRKHSRYLVVGGKDPVGTNDYYDTAFVVGTNGDIVFKQGKAVPIQFFKDGLPAPEQKVWNSPWGKIGFCVCYDLSYTRVTDELVRQGAQLLIVPTMDVVEWSRHEHELHSRVAPVRAADYGIPIFRVASSGISQAVDGGSHVVATAPMPGSGEILSAQLRLPMGGALPLDRWLAPVCTVLTALVTLWLLVSEWKSSRIRPRNDPSRTGRQLET
jgi:apolipoprotein N-acyltransferase